MSLRRQYGTPGAAVVATANDRPKPAVQRCAVCSVCGGAGEDGNPIRFYQAGDAHAECRTAQQHADTIRPHIEAALNPAGSPTCVACGRYGGLETGPLVEQGRASDSSPLMWHVACAPDREQAEDDLARLEDFNEGDVLL